MPHFGIDSKTRLYTIDDELQAVLNRSILHFNFKIIWGYRGEVAQTEAYLTGRSTKQWPDSKHNRNRLGEVRAPSMAVDIAPWPIDWMDVERFYYLAGWVMCDAAALGIALRWGGDWDRDTEVQDQSFFDLGHFELVT